MIELTPEELEAALERDREARIAEAAEALREACEDTTALQIIAMSGTPNERALANILLKVREEVARISRTLSDM